MKINKITLTNFRNIEKAELCPSDSVNVIYGNNAQGKTNLLEAIWLFTGFRSFRECDDGQMIKFGSDFFKNELEFETVDRCQTAEIVMSEREKRFFLNKVPLRTRSELIGNVRATCFAPTHIDIVKGSPSVRRKFIDTSISQGTPGYALVLSKYKLLVEQKNAYLKRIAKENCDESMLDIWDDQIAVAEEKIIKHRLSFLKKLGEVSAKIALGLSENSEQLEIKYIQTNGSAKREIDMPQTVDEIRETIAKSRKRDIFNAATGFGAHRDDIEITINGKSVKSYGSQGQQRSASLSLKLGESEILSNVNDDKSIILLDDVFSELDEKRQDYILNKIRGRQVFITCCDPNAVKRLSFGEKFRVEDGEIVN